MNRSHDFTSRIVWTGDRGAGTRTYRGYDRSWQIASPGKPVVECSNDPQLGGDRTRPNPEELLLASLAGCHMLWYLHLASEAGIVVRGYEDSPLGIGESGAPGEGRFVRAVLRPRILVDRGSDLAIADALHHRISAVCWIARSVSFPISYEASYAEV